MTKLDTLLKSVPELQPYLPNADHIDIKTVEGNVTMREFLAGMFSYYPGWLKFLYGVRGGFVRLLGMKQEGIPEFHELRPEEVCMTPGKDMAFFTVKMASERVWVAGIVDTHLNADLGIVREAGENGRFRFHIITIVHYNKWTGVVYFNVIRPFHHLVVAQMAKSGVNYTKSGTLVRGEL
jgi:hypothetical protein